MWEFRTTARACGLLFPLVSLAFSAFLHAAPGTDAGSREASGREAAVPVEVLPSIEPLQQLTPVHDRPVILDGRPGDREEIGLFTEWQSEFLATGRNRDLIIEQADSLLDAPWCDYDAMKTVPWKGGKYAVSFSHLPNLFFLPYLLTGDRKYVAPMECVYRILQEWPQKSRGSATIPALGVDGKRPMFWLTGRDYAWSLRNLAQLAYIEKRGDTREAIYIQALENTRQAALQRMHNPIESEFHVLGENQLAAANQWSGWFEGFIGMSVNHAINLGFKEWKPVAEWHFKHLQWRCGEKWPIKACDSDHVDVQPGGTWENTPQYNAERMQCYLAAPDDALMPTKCGNVFMTYDDRAQIARSWAAMAAANGIAGAAGMYAELDEQVRRRGGARWFKYSILPGHASASMSATESRAAPAPAVRPESAMARKPEPATAPAASNAAAATPAAGPPLTLAARAAALMASSTTASTVTPPEPAAAKPQAKARAEARPAARSPAPPASGQQKIPANHLLANVPAGTWIEIPDSKLQDILPPESFSQPIHYIVGPKAITRAWNGAVFNPDLQRLDIFSAGGHADYCGNEYLGFSLESLKWQLVHGPSDLTGFDPKTGTVAGVDPPTTGYAPDGRPISRHTYGGQVYHPGLKKSFMFGGSLCSGAGVADDRWWSVTPDGQYTQLGGVGAWASLGISSAYDPVSDNIFLTLSGNVTEFDVVGNRKIPRTNLGSNGRWGQVSAIDPTRNTLFVFGHAAGSGGPGGAYTYNTVTGVRKDVQLSGDLSIIERPGIGLAYVQELDRYAAWIDGGALYLIDPESFHVTVYQTRGKPPPGESPNGVYGRFAYSALYGGFVVVSAIDSNVFFLKLPEH